MKKKADILTGMLILAALICLVPVLCPYSVWRSAGDRLASDGDLERLTESLAAALRIAAAGAAALFAGLAVWRFAARERFDRFFASLGVLPAGCLRDAGPFFHDLRKPFELKDISCLLMLLIFAAGVILRVLRIGMPLLHDEAYSMAIWGRSDLLFAISDYHLPNNHVFHSVLINLVYHLLGKTPALLRLPVLVSGCLMIPSVWLLGKLIYNDRIALTAAGLTAFAPFLVFYSYNARGYEVQAFLSVLTVGLAVYGKRTRNLFAWFLLILFSALNFFTLPIALYPFGGICIWLFLNVIFFNAERCVFRDRRQLFKYLIFMGICVSVLSILLYVPLLRFSGWDSFFGNIYIGGTEAATFGETMISRLRDNVNEFTGTLPWFAVWIIAAGLVLSPFLFRKTASEHISYTASVLLWMGMLIPFQRPNLWPRTLLFLHPFVLLCAASGLDALTLMPKVRKAAGWICAALILCAGISQFYIAVTELGTVGPDEQAVRLILEREGENAANVHIVTAAEDNAPIWIYADAYGFPDKVFDKRQSFNTVYAFVNPLNDAYNGPQDLGDLLERFGPGDNFLDTESVEVLMDEPHGVLYRFEARESAVIKGYGEYPEIPK